MTTSEFPRSRLLRTIRDHPVATAATIAAIAYFGPARIAALSLAGLRATSRNAQSIAPIVHQIVRMRGR